MQWRTRMFKTLISLALTMSVCAALLSWMEPQDPTTATLTDAGFSRDQARRAIAMENNSGLFALDGVEIVVTPDLNSSRAPTVLAAAPRNPFHFVVSKHGLVLAGSSWHELSRKTSAEFTAVVLLGDTKGDGSLPVAQWLGLRALLIELADVFDATGKQPWIRIRPSDSSSSSRLTEELRTWLAGDGLLP